MGEIERPSLRALAEQYGADKLYSHSYIPVYEELFRNRTVRRLLEIGIGYRDPMEPFVPRYVHGASLWMWHDYFHEADIFACDIRADTLVQSDRITSYLCDQSKPGDLLKLIKSTGGNFDVVIDDGSHVTGHQILSAAILLPHVNPGGVYVIEDVQEPHVIRHELSPYIIRHELSPYEVEIYRWDKRSDDCLCMVRK